MGLLGGLAGGAKEEPKEEVKEDKGVEIPADAILGLIAGLTGK